MSDHVERLEPLYVPVDMDCHTCRGRKRMRLVPAELGWDRWESYCPVCDAAIESLAEWSEEPR